MPSFTGIIKTTGAELAIAIRPGEAMVRYLRDNGQSVPSPINLVGFLDTGANSSAIKRGELPGFTPLGRSAVTGVSGQTIAGEVFELEVSILEKMKPIIVPWVPLLVTEVDRPGGPLAHLLLGRDFLTNFVLIYNDPKWKFTLRW